jgi:hypothetical protein
MPDDGVCRTRAVTGTTQTKIQRRIPGCHHARPEKGGMRTKEQRAPRRVGTTPRSPTVRGEILKAS